MPVRIVGAGAIEHVTGGPLVGVPLVAVAPIIIGEFVALVGLCLTIFSCVRRNNMEWFFRRLLSADAIAIAT